MSKTMDKVTGVRFTHEQYKAIEMSAEKAGYKNVSEFLRRKATEDASDGLRDTIMFILELCLSTAAHVQVLFDANNMRADDRKETIDQYKLSLMEAWNERR